MWFYICGSKCIEVSEAFQSVVLSSHSIIIINHSFNTLTYKALSNPRKSGNSPCITYVYGFPQSNLSFSFRSNHSLHYATTLLHSSCFQATLLPHTTTASFPSLPSDCIPHTIQATPLFSSFHHCLSQSCCMPFYNPPFPTTVCWGCTIPLHDR